MDELEDMLNEEDFVYEMSYKEAYEMYEEFVDCTTFCEAKNIITMKPYGLRNVPSTYEYFFNEEVPSAERELSFEEFLSAFAIEISWESILEHHVPTKRSRGAKKKRRDRNSEGDNQGIHPLIRLKGQT